MQRCENCPNEFEPTKPVRSEQRFCSPECRKAGITASKRTRNTQQRLRQPNSE